MSDNEDRLAQTLAHLSGGRVSSKDVQARLHPDSEPVVMTASEVMQAIPPLSGSHQVSRTIRGSWAAQADRQPVDWERAAWPRDVNGRFVRAAEQEYDDTTE